MMIIIFRPVIIMAAFTDDDQLTVTGILHHERSGSSWQDIVTFDDLWNEYPEKVRLLFASLDLKHAGLESVEHALLSRDTIAAATALLEYYKTAASPEWLQKNNGYTGVPEQIRSAERVLNNEIIFRGNFVRIPTDVTGGWDWNYTGKEPEAELGYTLNRHRFFIDLLGGWQETGNTVYAEKFDSIIRDWIIHNPLPPEDDLIWEVLRTTTAELDWRDTGEVVWRVLEPGLRLAESWPLAFYGFQQAEDFTPAARLMMLFSIPVHANYIQENHSIHHNHVTMEMDGLSFAGLTFPEFKQSENWISHAVNVMLDEISEGQVNPDGVQREMATAYHWAALIRFEKLADNFRLAGRSLPEEYIERIEAMYEYLAYSMGPDGYIPMNNDSYRLDIRPAVLKAAERYNRPDWIYIATNGDEGVKPQGLPSRVFPWSGLHIMRNGWEKNGQWAFFKTGPYGTGHQHRDKLHLSVRAYGRDLLVDSGYYTYEDYFSFDPTVWRGYFRSSFSQNVILIDSAGQNTWSRIAEEPHVDGLDYYNTIEFDYAQGTFAGGYEKIGGENIHGYATHRRSVVYVKDKFWVVLDQIVTDRPRLLQTLWRYAPDLNVEIEGDQSVSINLDEGNLRIVPAGDISWKPELVRGQTEPHIMGWYSESSGKKEPCTTVVFSAYIDNDAIFAWILVPAYGNVQGVQAQTVFIQNQTANVKVELEGEEPVSVLIPLKGSNRKVEVKN